MSSARDSTTGMESSVATRNGIMPCTATERLCRKSISLPMRRKTTRKIAAMSM